MKIAIVNLTGGGLSGGYRKYLRALVPRLVARTEVRNVDVFSPQSTRELLHGVPGNHHYPSFGTFLHRELRQAVLRAAPDVVLIPTARTIDLGIPVTTMVRNMEPLALPFANRYAAEMSRTLLRRAAARYACARSERIIAVSNYVRDFLVAEWAVPSSRIGVVYHGVDAVGDCVDTAIPKVLASIASAPFLFTAGSIRPARGLEDAIGAFGDVAAQVPALRLVIAGSTNGGEAYHDSLKALLRRSRVEDRTLWTGELNSAEMGWCYQRCAGFLMTSRVEACPNTALEALANGANIVSTRNPPMPEFFGEAALYYAAGNRHALAMQLTVLLHRTASEKREWSAAGRMRVADYTWDRAAAATVAELRHCIVSSHG